MNDAGDVRVIPNGGPKRDPECITNPQTHAFLRWESHLDTTNTERAELPAS
jgi:hypothetical protein